MLKNIGYKISVVVLLSMILGLIGYNHYIENKNAESLSKQKVTTSEELKPVKKTNNIIAIGDQFVNSNINFTNTLATEANANVTQFGGISDTSIDVAIRAMAINVYVNKITIPTSVKPIPITLYNEQGRIIDALHGTSNNFINVSINGITGKVFYNSDEKKLYFARDAAGEQVKINKLTQVLIKEVNFNSNDTYVFFVGQNDPYYKGSIFKTINNINAIVKKYNITKYVVVSLTSKRHYVIVDDMNDVLKTEYKDHYLDFRSYLLTNGLKDAGIQPTKQDTTDIAQHKIPTSLLNQDLFTGNKSFNDLLAKQLYEKLKALNYLQ